MLTVDALGHSITKMILGGNPFSSNSHLSRARDTWMRNHFTPERVADIMDVAAKAGINTFLGRADDHIFACLAEHRRRNETPLQWICQTAPERGTVAQSVEEAVPHGPMAIYLHGVHATSLYEGGYGDKLQEAIDIIHATGLPAGIGAHRPQVVDLCEERGYGADFYVLTFNTCGYLCPASFERVHETILKTPKPIVLIKVLGAAREKPTEALPRVLDHCKPQDMLCIGITFAEEIDENLAIIEAHQQEKEAATSKRRGMWWRVR